VHDRLEVLLKAIDGGAGSHEMAEELELAVNRLQTTVAEVAAKARRTDGER
jgi:hypothetical protein